jgi:hypothetical protein
MKSTITASIGGKEYACQIHREDLRFFEALNGSALQMFKLISGGLWKDEDIRKVIGFAVGRRPRQSDLPEHYAMHASLIAMRGPKETFLDRAITKHGVGTYAPLAMAILAACLFGVTDDESVFTDGAVDG